MVTTVVNSVIHNSRSFKLSEIVPENRAASLGERKPVNCCHDEKKQTKIQRGIQDQSGA